MSDVGPTASSDPVYAYLGPPGTFTEMALRTIPGAAAAGQQPCSSVPAALDAVRTGAADAALVPIENSVEGAVPVTLDELASGQLLIVREVLLPVSFALLARTRLEPESCKRVATHPHAAAQTRKWLTARLPDAEVTHVGSTAAAAAEVAEPGSPYDAAVAPRLAAERYGLDVVADRIEDNADAVTRFVLVARPAEARRTVTGPSTPVVAAGPTGADKTSLVAFIRDDHPGALLQILDEFAVRGVNLTWIESRPTGSGLGRYCFSIDCAGHLDEARVGEALMGLRRVCADVRFLGSYPRADELPGARHSGTTDADFQHAATWLDALRRGDTTGGTVG